MSLHVHRDSSIMHAILVGNLGTYNLQPCILPYENEQKEQQNQGDQSSAYSAAVQLRPRLVVPQYLSTPSRLGLPRRSRDVDAPQRAR